MGKITNIEVTDYQTIIVECLIKGKTKRFEVTFEALDNILGKYFWGNTSD